ncbi:GD23365 [Drosophila simulans]|uniref:GD23365 n=1 Tax=Drosophila simulans TaxID=7240 RepID=B4Q431_DROSI|nr:GD23365 [Drosophila simulans]
MIMTMMLTGRSWQRESDAEQRKQHKQRWRPDGAHISAAYDLNSDNDDGHHRVVHNQNNGSPNSSPNQSTSAFRQRQPHRPPTGQQPSQLPCTVTHFSGHWTTLLILLTLLSTSALTASANVTSTISPPINGSSTDYILLYGDSTTSLVPALTTGLSGDGSGAVIEDEEDAEKASEYIFDRTDVRIIFITLYTLVFCCCFFGE